MENVRFSFCFLNFSIKMTEILCKWLNNEVKLSKKIGRFSSVDKPGNFPPACVQLSALTLHTNSPHRYRQLATDNRSIHHFGSVMEVHHPVLALGSGQRLLYWLGSGLGLVLVLVLV